MRRLIQFLARLYPQRWRSRYGPEFAALLEDANPSARTALNVLTGALAMQIRTTRKALYIALLAVVPISIASWYAGKHPYISPGADLVLHDASGLGAIVGFLVVVASIFTFLLACVLDHHRKDRSSRKLLLASVVPLAIYSLLVSLVSLVTPRTIVSVGDSYCYDEVCVGVKKVESVQEGPNVLYKTQVRIFIDSVGTNHNIKGARVYMLDEQGRHFPLEDGLPQETLGPGGSVNAQLTFTAAADSRHLYLRADEGIAPPWVYLYFGSDISLFHRRTLLRVL